jgi:hypothetical protein
MFGRSHSLREDAARLFMLRPWGRWVNVAASLRLRICHMIPRWADRRPTITGQLFGDTFRLNLSRTLPRILWRSRGRGVHRSGSHMHRTRVRFARWPRSDGLQGLHGADNYHRQRRSYCSSCLVIQSAIHHNSLTSKYSTRSQSYNLALNL